ncbi:hypothetical protein LJR044_000081 [Microbacterium foliorum]
MTAPTTTMTGATHAIAATSREPGSPARTVRTTAATMSAAAISSPITPRGLCIRSPTSRP